MTKSYTKKIKSLLKEMRVWQWTKNVLVFAPVIFGAKLFNLNILIDIIFTFFAISFAASTVYIINDILDIKEDQNHPTKKNRPIACGDINKKESILLVTTTFILSIIFSTIVSTSVLILVVMYIILNLFYSKIFKHKEVIDILMVAFFYIYRVYLGGVASGSSISGWLILTTFFLSLFMITGKRRAEIVSNKGTANHSRKVLNLYNEKFLDAALIISLTLLIVFYSLYSVLIQNSLFILTIFPVIFISLRYLYLVFAKNDGEEPEKLIFKDKEIFIAGVILGLYIILDLYFKFFNTLKL